MAVKAHAQSGQGPHRLWQLHILQMHSEACSAMEPEMSPIYLFLCSSFDCHVLQLGLQPPQAGGVIGADQKQAALLLASGLLSVYM